MTQEQKIYLVDGSGFIFRAFHATPPNLTRADGTPINAVMGFCNMLFKLILENKTHNIIVVFDAARKTFRNDIYADYKAHRKDVPEELVPQFPIIREAVEAFNLPQIEMDGYEADDLIATYAKDATKKGLKTVIVSSDKDLMQLVNDNVSMYDSMKSKVIERDQVFEKFGVYPDKVIDVQALAGDSADNVPGVEGIGVKTAALLINEYGDLETLLKRAGEIKQDKRREKLIRDTELAKISKQLVTLEQDVPVTVKLDDLKSKDIDVNKLSAFLEEQGLKSLITRVKSLFGNNLDGTPPLGGSRRAEGDAVGGNDNINQQKNTPHKITTDSTNPSSSTLPQGESENAFNIKEIKAEYKLIQDEKQLDALIKEIESAGIVAVDTETTSLVPSTCDLVGLSFCCKEGKAYYLPVGHKGEEGQHDLFGSTETKDIKQLDIKTVIKKLKPIFEDDSILKVGHNLKYDYQVLMQHGIHLHPVDDTMLMSYLLDGATHGHGLDELSELYFNHTNIKFSDMVEKGKNFSSVPIEKACDYASEDADMTMRLYNILKPRMVPEKVSSIYEKVERPLISVLAKMEFAGISVDKKALDNFSAILEKDLEKLTKEIHKMAGEEFNIASPQQLSEIIFEKMGIKGGKKTKTGSYSTNSSILEPLAEENPIIAKVLEYRKYAKLDSTYAKALPKQIQEKTGKIHTSYSMTGTNTGRLSSSNPNLQNIPIRNELGREIRKAFVPSEDCILVSADYSQMQLRLAAAMADCETMKQAFADNEDIHTKTASLVFGVPEKDMTPEVRFKAKAINFGIIFGISAHGLAVNLGCSRQEAKEYLDSYLEKYKEIKQYMDGQVEFAKANGFVLTMFGRKIYTPTINDSNKMSQNFAIRQAMNAPIQGSEADIIKMAMAKIMAEFEKQKLQSKVVLQIHDELIVDAKISEKETVKTILKEIMESCVDIGIPLIADPGEGKNWDEAH